MLSRPQQQAAVQAAVLVMAHIVLPCLAVPAGCPASGGWELDQGDLVCARMLAACKQQAASLYQELYSLNGQETYCCRCQSDVQLGAAGTSCPDGWTQGMPGAADATADPCWQLATGPCKQAGQGQFSQAFAPAYCCACSAAGNDPPLAAAPNSATAMLETGKWPLTAEQTACIRQSAEASEAFGNYLAASLVLGSVLAYGDSNITASLLASPDAKAVLQLPVSRIGADYQAWFEAAAQQCSLPRYQLPNSTDAALGWWASLSEAGPLAAAGEDMTATTGDEAFAAADPSALALVSDGAMGGSGRRLLWSLRDLVGGAAEEVAYAGGMLAGLGSGALGNILGTAITTVGVAAVVAAGGPAILVGAGIVGAVALGLASSNMAEDLLDEGTQWLYNSPEKDTTLEAYYEAGQDLGNWGGAIVVPGTSTAVKVVSKAEDSIAALGKKWWQASKKARVKNAEILRDERRLAELAGQTDDAARTERRSLNGRRGANIRWAGEYADDAKKAAIAGGPSLGSDVAGGILADAPQFQECRYRTRTILQLQPQWNVQYLGQAQASSIEECCTLCRGKEECLLYAWCRADANDCTSRPGKQYTFAIPGLNPKPGVCGLFSADSPRLDSIYDAHPETPWDQGILADEDEPADPAATSVGATDASGSSGTTASDASGSTATAATAAGAGTVVHCASTDCPKCKEGLLCTGFPLDITEPEDALGVCSFDGTSGCLPCMDGVTPCPSGFKCLRRVTYDVCFPDSFQIPPPGPDGFVHCASTDCPGCYGSEPRLCTGYPLSITEGDEGVGICGGESRTGCSFCSADDPCPAAGYQCVKGQSYDVCKRA